MSKLLSHPAALCNIVRRIAKEAGDEKILPHYCEGMPIASEGKSDGSPVTAADRAAERFIEECLQSHLPDIPVIGEEAVAEGRTKNLDGAEYFWLVDPLDGTKAFVAGEKDFTVNIALIHQGRPVLGVIYAPAHDDLYAAYEGGPAIKCRTENHSEKVIQVRKARASGLIVMASQNRSFEETERYLEGHKVKKIIRKSSSLKMCFIAAGKADLHPGLAQTCEWDTAAAQAILNAAGGELVDLETQTPLTYGHAARKFVNPPFIARSLDVRPPQ